MNLIIHIVSIITLTFCSTNKFSLPYNENNIHLRPCLDNILNNLDEKLIFTIDLDLQVDKPVARFSSKLEKLAWFQLERSEVIVINPNDNNLNPLVLQNMFNNPIFSPRSTIIVIVNQVENFLFRTASKFFLKQLLVIETNTSLVPNIYSYKPYGLENVNNASTEFFLLGGCNSDLEIKFDDVPQKWRNTTIQILNNIVPPYCMCPLCPKNPGIEVEAFDIIAKRLQFKVNYMRSSFIYWGTKMNGTYSYILGMLQRREGDMGLGVFHSKFDDFLDFELTFSYMEDSSKWMVPSAKILPYWKRLSLIFTKEVYLFLLFSLLVMVVICRFVYNSSLDTALLNLYQILLECSLPRLPMTNRSVIIVWISSCLVVSTMFKSKLIDTLSRNSYEHQIETLEDITNSGLHITIDHDLARFYKDEAYIQEHYEYCPDPRACINRTAFVQDCVAVDFQRTKEFFMWEFVDAEGNLLVQLLKKPIFPVHIHLFFVKGYPIFSQINDLLLLLRSNGIIQHLYDKAGSDAKMAMSKKTLFKVEVLGLDQMLIAFFIWGVGIFIACGLFVVEVFTNFKCKVCL